jgi:hypothetical protein
MDKSRFKIEVFNPSLGRWETLYYTNSSVRIIDRAPEVVQTFIGNDENKIADAEKRRTA